METSQELDIKRYIRLVYKRRFLFVAVTLLVTSAVVALSYVMPKKFEATSTVLIERNFLNTVMKDIAVTPNIDERVNAISIIMKSRPLILKVIKDIDLDLMHPSDADIEQLIYRFQKDTVIKIEMNRSTRDMDLFTVSLTHKDPIIARDFVNTLVRRYIEQNLSSKKDEAFGVNKFLLEQIDLFKEKINTIEAKIAGMRQQKMIDSEDRLALLQKRLSELLTQYTDNHPEVIKVKDEIEMMKGKMKGSKQPMGKGRDGATRYETGSLNHKNQSDAESRTSVNDLNANVEQQVGDLHSSRSGDELKIKELERDRDTYRKIYEEMLAALGRSEVSSHIEMQDKGATFKILEPAVLPVKPVGLDRVKIILLAIVAGIVAGIGFIILLESIDKSVKNVDALNDFGPPVLAVIPHIEIPSEIRKTRIKDLALYTITGIYYAGIVTVLALEMLGKEIK